MCAISTRVDVKSKYYHVLWVKADSCLSRYVVPHGIYTVDTLTQSAYIRGAGWGGGGGSRIRYSIKNVVFIRDSVSEISP